MGQYLSPGVYVEEVPPLARPIAGVGTSTPGFIGVIPDTIQLPSRPLAGETEPFRWVAYTLQAEAQKAYRITSWNAYVKLFGDFIGNNTTPTKKVTVEGEGDAAKTYVTGVADPGLLVTATWKPASKMTTADEKGNYRIEIDKGFGATVTVTAANGTPTEQVVVEGTGEAEKTYVTGVTNAGASVTATWEKRVKAPANKIGTYKIEIDKGAAESGVTVTTIIAASGAEIDKGQRHLAHAVYGFFNNGGTSCYVIRIAKEENLDIALRKFEAESDITIVAAPGLTSAQAFASLIGHCEKLQDRVAILDSVESTAKFDEGDFGELEKIIDGANTTGRPQNSTYAAFYFPWLQVFDPATSLTQSATKGDGLIFVPPSGHIAGIYARSDATRGVFKAPANEALQGVTGLRYSLSKANQDYLNDDGVNLIRPLIGAFRVWGARTVGGDANGEYRYISTRRYFNYLRESIDQGTQFVVFEPNSPALWERIKRTVGDFLLREWRSGALFGTTPDKAFFVNCDKDTNPREVREAGQVVTEIGVAIVKPAEFVIFRIQQMTGS